MTAQGKAGRTLLHVFPGFGVGGAQVRFCAIANRFGRRWRHLIYAMDGNLACRERLDATLDVAFPALGLRKGETLGNLRRCRAALREWRPDVLVTSNFGSIEWALANAFPRRAVPHIHTEDGFGPEERDRQLPRRVWLRRLALRRSRVVVPSRVLERIATGTWRLAPGQVRYVSNGVDLARFAPRPHAAAEAPVVVGAVAALRPEKNLARLLRAVALVPEVRLVVVGDGGERAALQTLAATLGIATRVNFAGHLAEPQGAYARFDVFALSSDTEQMPLSVLEAMAAGLPVVSTDVGDVAGMVATENRRFVVSRHEQALATAIAALAADPGLRAEIGSANRVQAETRFDQETMFAAYAALFDAAA